MLFDFNFICLKLTEACQVNANIDGSSNINFLNYFFYFNNFKRWFISKEIFVYPNRLLDPRTNVSEFQKCVFDMIIWVGKDVDRFLLSEYFSHLKLNFRPEFTTSKIISSGGMNWRTFDLVDGAKMHIPIGICCDSSKIDHVQAHLFKYFIALLAYLQ